MKPALPSYPHRTHPHQAPPHRALRHARRVAALALVGAVALTALAGGSGLSGHPSAASADEYQVVHIPTGALGGVLPLPPPAPKPPTPSCGSPTLSVLDDQHQAATRLVQGETVTAWVTCFQYFGYPPSVQIAFDGVTLGTVTVGSQATFTMPYSVPGGNYETFTASWGGEQATYTVWYDYAPQ